MEAAGEPGQLGEHALSGRVDAHDREGLRIEDDEPDIGGPHVGPGVGEHDRSPEPGADVRRDRLDQADLLVGEAGFGVGAVQAQHAPHRGAGAQRDAQLVTESEWCHELA